MTKIEVESRPGDATSSRGDHATMTVGESAHSLAKVRISQIGGCLSFTAIRGDGTASSLEVRCSRADSAALLRAAASAMED